MKKFILLSLLFLTGLQSQAYVVGIDSNWSNQFDETSEVQNLTPDMINMQLEEFLSLTPKKYRQKTGKRLGLKKALKLKAAQKVVKKKFKAGEDISSGLYVLLVILGLGWVAMGIMDDWSGSNWITNLILSFLCWLPGLIHGLAKKKDYY